jgi:hypothetical protein
MLHTVIGQLVKSFSCPMPAKSLLVGFVIMLQGLNDPMLSNATKAMVITQFLVL